MNKFDNNTKIFFKSQPFSDFDFLFRLLTVRWSSIL